MFNKLFAIVLFATLVFAMDRPLNYWAGQSSGRGDQQTMNNFAAYNVTSKNWNVVLPPGISRTQIYGIVSVGTGLLAYGSFTSFGGGSNNAAGLVYYNGKIWSAPEGVGLYRYNAASTNTRYMNIPTGTGTAYAATVIGNDVYLLGNFNQVGLQRGGVAGFVKLTWSAGGVFTIGTVGNGYYETEAGVCSSFCPGDNNPGSGSKNKLKSFTANSITTFVYQDSNDIWTFQPNSASWIRVSRGNGAVGIGGNIKDYDIFNNNIYVVGNFDNTKDSNPAKQYLHIAVTPDAGVTWNTISTPQPFNTSNFAALDAVFNTTNGNQIYPALSADGLSAIVVESATSIYVAGGWRVTERNETANNLAGDMQTRVFQISGTTLNMISERFGRDGVASTGLFIDSLHFNNNTLYALGSFDVYRQVYVNGQRYTHRYTEVMRGAAQFSNNQWTPALGGYLTQSGDSISTEPSTAWIGGMWYFMSNALGGGSTITSSYNLISGGIFAYGGEKKRNQDKRWNSILGNQRFSSASSYSSNSGVSEGLIRTLHKTTNGDTLIIGGRFDWIGSQRIGGVAWYSYDQDIVGSVGGGLFYYNNMATYHSDDQYNNRIGGDVWDFEEKGDYLYAAGLFNRNNSGSALYNIARAKFRIQGEGWEPIDGGCDDRVRDILFMGDYLYATGDFQYCGLITDDYDADIVRGRVPTAYIAVIDVTEKKMIWRNLGAGLNGVGYAMAYRGGDLFVGGAFSSAAGKLSTSGIARWRGNHWEDVLEDCKNSCDRPPNLALYISSRKPGVCYNLKEIDGRIYCIDGLTLSYLDGNTWYQSQLQGTNSYVGKSNTMIVRNATRPGYILFSANPSGYVMNSQNLATYETKYFELTPTYGGFSVQPNAFSSANTIVSSTLLLIAIIFVSFLF